MLEEKRPENTLIFNLYFLHIDNETDVNAKCIHFSELVASWVLQYPWYNERFALSLSPVKGLQTPSLCGRLHFGDSIEDEWFVVWILLRLTHVDHHVVIQVTDEDGEFLLIEAADVLPKWLNPENCRNRVWLHRGKITIIQSKKKNSIAFPEAIAALKEISASSPSERSFETAIQEIITRKISHFPQFVRHCTHLLLPYPAAAILSLPSSDALIGAAVFALANLNSNTTYSSRTQRSNSLLFSHGYQRNVNSSATSRWPNLRNQSGQFVLRPYSFNRLHYSRLRALPTPAGIKHPRLCHSAAERLATEFGIKLCTGLDLVLATPPSSVSGCPSFQSHVTDNDPAWLSFWTKLQNQFTDSQICDSLKEDAKLYYRDHISKICDSCTTDDYYNWSVRHPSAALYQMLDAIEQNPTTVPSFDHFVSQESSLPCPDDDSWMFITPEELDATLAAHSSGATWQRSTPQESESIASKIADFVSASSSFEGVDLFTQRAGSKRTSYSVHANYSLSDTDDDGDTFESGSSDDSEAGYSEAKELVPKVIPSKSSNLPISMADLMDSLMCGVDRSSVPKWQKDVKSSGLAVGTQLRGDHQLLAGTLATSSSDEELLDMYSAGSDLRADYGQAVTTIPSGDSADEYPTTIAHTSKSIPVVQESGPTTLDRIIPPSWSAVKNVLYESVGSTSDEKPTTGEVCRPSRRLSKPISVKTNAHRSSSSSGALPSSPNDDDEDAHFAEYITQMENELSGQPANTGRCIIETTSTIPSQFRSMIARNKDGISDRKKLRRVPANVPLAVPENADSLDRRDGVVQSQDDLGDTSQLHPTMTEHVCKHLLASAIGGGCGPPTGPAAHLLSALGLPVHQLAAVASTNLGASSGGNDRPEA